MKKKTRRLNPSVAGVIRGNTLSHFASYFFVAALFLAQTSYAAEEANPKPVFKLVKGQGVEVCEAYLQRLNITEYLDNNPAKGRITEPLLDGFSDLKPVPLTDEELQRLQPRILSFIMYQNQFMYQNKFLESEFGYYSNLKFILANKKTPYIRYKIPLDLDNNGVIDDIVITKSNGSFIVDKGLKNINEERMRQVFADQNALEWPSLNQFPTLAYPTTVFSYKNNYYFDGIINGLCFERGMPVTIAPIDEPYILGVFIHQHHKTKKICEYEWTNSFQNVIFNY